MRTLVSEIVKKTAQHILEKFQVGKFDCGIVLGSGLGTFPTVLENKKELSYSDIPHMPRTTVSGHEGKLIFGMINKVSVLCFSGRVHAYEGIPWANVCFQVQLMSALGIRLYVLTNAAGGILDNMYNSCIMLIEDHFRFTARVDPNYYFLPTEKKKNDSMRTISEDHDYWNIHLRQLVEDIAADKKIQLFHGSYCWCAGPSYETPLEVQALKIFGGGSVGMSTVPEILMARQVGIRVVGLSMITNLAAGISKEKLSHEEVSINAKKGQEGFNQLIAVFIEKTFDIDFSPENSNITPTQKKAHSSLFEPKLFTLISDSDFDSLSTKLISNLKSEHIQKSALHITSTFESSSFKSLVILPLDCPSNFTTLQKSIEIDELDHFPLNSIQGANTTLKCIHHNGDKHLLLQSNLNIKESVGFSTEEATYLALLFHRLGVSKAIHYVGARISNEEINNNNVLIDDVYNFSHLSRSCQYLYSMLPRHAHHKITTMPSSSGGKSYMVFSGPSLPSMNEQKIAKNIGATFVGTYIPSITYTLRFLGIPVQMIAIDSPETAEISFIESINNGEENKPSSNTLSIDEMNNGIDSFKFSASKQYTYEEVEQAKNFILKIVQKYNATVNSAVIDFDLDVNLEESGSCQLVESLDLDQIPNVNLFYNGRPKDGGKKAQLEFYKLNDKEEITIILVCKLNADPRDSGYFQDCSFIARTLQQIEQISNIYLLSSCMTSKFPSSTTKPGSICILKDHVNLTGENPLTGSNEEKWGPRFFDMSEPYAQGLTNEIIKVHQNSSSNIPLIPAKCIFHEGENFVQYSKLQRSTFAEILDCNIVSSMGIRESITIRHLDSNKRVLSSVFLAIPVDDAHSSQITESLQSNPLYAATKKQVSSLICQTSNFAKITN